VTGQTLYAQFPAWGARLLIAAVIMLVGLATLSHTLPNVPLNGQPNVIPNAYTDSMLYKAIVFDVEHGKGYYEAAAAEQRAHGYPTTPAVVFREPTLTWLLVALHFAALRTAVLIALYLTAILAFFRSLIAARLSMRVRVITVISVVTGSAIVAVPEATYLHEAWAAVLMSMSLVLYREDRWWPSVGLGVLACLFRELALPYLFVMAAFALYAKRWRELGGWAFGIAAFAAAFSVHLAMTSALHRPGDLVSAGWIGFGGWNFALTTTKWNLLLHVLPAPLIVLLVCLGIIGLAGSRDGRAQRAALTVGGYLIAFLFAGRFDNYCWGVLYAPLLPLGFVLAPAAVRELFFRAIPSPRGVP
jgi:hypothetical protein